ncbi:alpha-amylase family glycosyl hydrolase [Alkalihalobacterium sp. APHAB7]|uniref:alpha-amylase family glycosyl hydrolase n=1 Tax=Alkalihalobacterium sp. APHAB7 TaxID=3402081 RepID=UPI003AAA5AF5
MGKKLFQKNVAIFVLCIFVLSMFTSYLPSTLVLAEKRVTGSTNNVTHLFNSSFESALENTNNTGERQIYFIYEREDGQYEGWNIWVWDTEYKDDQIDFTEYEDGKAIATITIGPYTERVGFVLRDTDDWDTATKDVEQDRFIDVNKNDQITKVFVTSGEIPFETVSGTETDIDTSSSNGETNVVEVELEIEGSTYPEVINYNQNAVLTLSIESKEELTLREIYVDLSEVGGREKVAVDVDLREVSIAIDRSITAGVKSLPVVVVDQYGNRHTGEVNIEVAARTFTGEADFDWDEARIYFLLTDRFFDGDPSNNDPYGIGYNTEQRGTYQGGDFKGITSRLDYLYDLGINTIWISPIVENIKYDVRHEHPDTPYYGYHGYWASHFEELNPHFGTMDDFHELIDEAHDRGMKIMIDVVLNHTGYGLKEADAVYEDEIPFFPTAEERDRFAGMLRDGGTGTVRGELAGLPDFLTEDPTVREQVIQWQVDWIEKSRTPNGNTIDYFRVDTVKHVEDTTWLAFKNELTRIMPEFKLIGESWGAGPNDDHGYLNTGMMDSLLDFDFKNEARNFANGQLENVQQNLEVRNAQLSNAATLGQFLGSHDEAGFLELVRHDIGKLKVGAALQITAKGQPVIYYGEELGLSGLDNYPYYDNRYDMAWEGLEDNEVLAHYKKLLNIRKDHSEVFSKGTRAQVAGSDEEGFIIFERSYDDRSILVGLNTNDEVSEISFEAPFEGNVMDLYSNEVYEVFGNEVTVQLPSRSDGGTVILVESREGLDNHEAPVTDNENAHVQTVFSYLYWIFIIILVVIAVRAAYLTHKRK